MAELSFGVKIWGDIKGLLDSLKAGKSATEDFGKKAGSDFKTLSKEVGNAERNFKNLAAQLGINSKEAQEALAAFRALSSQKKEINDALKPPAESKSMFAGLKSELLGVAAGYLGVVEVGGRVVEFFKGALEGAMADERAYRRLSNALEGNSSSLEGLISYKEQMMESTLFTEDEIMGAITMGVELGRTEEQTRKMVETAMGLSNVTGQDLNTAMIQLSATFDGNIGKLGKFAPGLKELSDRQLENGEAIEILNKRFGRFATEGLTTVEGRVAQAKKKFEEFSDAIGESILKWLGFVALEDNTQGGKMAKQEAEDIAAYMKMNKEERKKYIDDVQKQQDEYYRKWQEAKNSGDVKNREHYSIQFADTKTFLDKVKAIKIDTAKKATKEEVKEYEKAAKEEFDLYKKYRIAASEGKLVGPKYWENQPSGIDKMQSKGIMLDAAPAPQKITNNDLGSNEVKTTLTDMIQGIDEAKAAAGGLGGVFSQVFSGISDLVVDFKEGFKNGWKDAMGAVASIVQGATQFISGLFTAGTEKRLRELDSETEAARSAIENSRMSEEQKKKALDKLDADTAKKRKELMRQQAKDQKVAAVMQAVVAGALAVVQAYAIPMVGMLMGTLMLGLVAAQVATIIAQPLPALAGGGLANAPTMAIVGDNPNARIDPEVISPLSKLKEMFYGGMQDQAQLVSVIRGEDVYFMLQRVDKKVKRIS